MYNIGPPHQDSGCQHQQKPPPGLVATKDLDQQKPPPGLAESLSPAEQGWLPSRYLVLFIQIQFLSLIQCLSYHSKSIFLKREKILREQIQSKLQLPKKTQLCPSSAQGLK
jgi:hypothetical protein